MGDGWHVRRTIRGGDMAGDIPFFVGLVMLAGAVLGAGAALLWDLLIHRHHEQRRHCR